MPSLLKLRYRKSPLASLLGMSSGNGPRRRALSPAGGSTLMTSAPRSPRIRAQYGPEPKSPRSRTRSPARAALPIPTPPIGFARRPHATERRAPSDVQDLSSPASSTVSPLPTPPSQRSSGSAAARSELARIGARPTRPEHGEEEPHRGRDSTTRTNTSGPRSGLRETGPGSLRWGGVRTPVQCHKSIRHPGQRHPNGPREDGRMDQAAANEHLLSRSVWRQLQLPEVPSEGVPVPLAGEHDRPRPRAGSAATPGPLRPFLPRFALAAEEAYKTGH